MLSRRSPKADESPVDDEERARIQARLDALVPAGSVDETRRIGPLSAEQAAAYDGSLAQPGSPAHSRSIDVEPRAYLVTSDGGILAELPCHAEAAPLTLGRSRTADIRIDDPYVHRIQAMLSWDAGEGTHIITHAGGENGTYVNRHRVQKPLRLAGDEKLRIGKTRLLYRIRR